MKKLGQLPLRKEAYCIGAFAAVILFSVIAVSRGREQRLPVSAETAPKQTACVDFLTDYSEALRVAAEEEKPLLLFFTEPASPFSARVLRNIFADETVAEKCRDFVCVEIDTGRSESFPMMRKFGITCSPTVQFVSARGAVLLHIDQFGSPAEFRSRMETVLRPVAWQQASLFLR